MSITNKFIGKRIASARKVAGLTQAELSEKIGISEKYLSRIECGKQVPSTAIVAKICEMLCVSADKLLSLNHSTVSKNIIQNELDDFSVYEQNQIIEIIKIIKEIKNQP